MDPNANQAGQKDDYVDKGLSAAEKKFGGPSMQDQSKMKGINEKVVCCSIPSFPLPR